LDKIHGLVKIFPHPKKILSLKKIKDLKDKSDNIQNQLQSENDCERNVELKSQLKVLKLHVESL